MDIGKMRVQDLMRTDVKTVSKGTTIFDAAKMMNDYGVSSLIVEPDVDGDAFGIITRKDILEALISRTNGSAHLVEHLMTKPVITVNLGLSIYNCHKMMRMVGVRRLPVVDGTALVGILSNTDIFNKLVERI
jgi:CBS domain-containing protein